MEKPLELTQLWDVIVVGAGPAGATAARYAAEGGAKVLLLDRARFPRYKTCGGGIIGVSNDLLPPKAKATVELGISRGIFSYNQKFVRQRRSNTNFVGMVQRQKFDQALVDTAVESGATFLDGVQVKEISEGSGLVELRAGDLTFKSKIVIGADGSSGRIARYVGVEYEETDLGLESEIQKPEGTNWDDGVWLDWGKAPGSYAWVFPKNDRLTVGVIQSKGNADETRAYLDAWIDHLKLRDQPVLHSSGHLTKWRAPQSPLVKGNVIVAGDAAGFLEPWTREGISFALRSGKLAGTVAASAIVDNGKDRPSNLAQYEIEAVRLLGEEQEVGKRLLKFFEKRPWVFHVAIGWTNIGWRKFTQFCSGKTDFPTILRRHPIVKRFL
jgi:geranylgeranyl reductase family protein